MKLKFIILIGLQLSLSGCFNLLDFENDIDEYEHVLSEWKQTGLINHFPQKIPEHSNIVKFSSFPGFLQGGGWVQLRLELHSNEIEQAYAGAMKRSRQYHDGGGLYTMVNRQKDGLASSNFHTSGTNDREFPKDYRVFIFEAKPYKTGSAFDWNHGKSMGIAVSKNRNEVVYWAENW